MAAAKTKEFEIYIETLADPSDDNTVLDLTDYVDIADNQAFEIHEVNMVLDPTFEITVSLTSPVEARFQLADSNIQSFVSHADRTSLFVYRQLINGVTGQQAWYEQESFSSITPLIVSKTLWLRNATNSNSLPYTMRIKGRIVTPSAKDYMALVLTQTGNVA